MDNNFNNYLNEIKNSFSVVNNTDVLEIGALHGEHSKLIKAYNPKSLTILEPEQNFYNQLTEKFSDCTVHCIDAVHYLQTPKRYDVVVCCGVLYHLHSPLYLLELIKNNVDPSYVILENIDGDNSFREEELNTVGNRITHFEKEIGLHLSISYEILQKAMYDLGYGLVEKIGFLDKDVHHTKKQTIMTVWSKN